MKHGWGIKSLFDNIEINRLIALAKNILANSDYDSNVVGRTKPRAL